MSDNMFNSLYKLYSTLSENKEFEISYNNKNNKLSLEKYIKLLKYIKNISSDDSLKNSISLDINYSLNNINWRISVSDINNINYVIKNEDTYNDLLLNCFKNIKNYSLMKKDKARDISGVVDIPSLNLRGRLSEETTNISKSDYDMLFKSDTSLLNYRLKNRTTLLFEDYKIDLTIIKSGKSYYELKQSYDNYELEIESLIFKPSKDHFNKMIKEMCNLLKIIQNSNFLITVETSNAVIDYYKKMLSTNNNISLDGRKPISLEIQYLNSDFFNKYAVTDKADGDRYFLIIYDKKAFLISNLLEVIYTGIVLKNNTFDGSILDGELIFLQNRHLFLVFDCLIHKGIDIRSESSLMKRLSYADDIINSCFILNEQLGFKFKNYDPNINNIKFYELEMKKNMDALNHDINIDKTHVLIRRKFFIDVKGLSEWEIFQYSKLIWEGYTLMKNINCPYILDGLIYQPLQQSYITVNSKYNDFKWKPENKNSIDFYVTYVKSDTNQELAVYDNSYTNKNSEEDVEYVPNKYYKILKLHVGSSDGDKQVPIPFKENLNLHHAYIYLDNNEARDINGDIILDKTVVEFYYDALSEKINNNSRWIPLRTRYDKTENVHKYKTGYGNYKTVAERVWGSIINPITFNDIIELSKGNDINKNEFIFNTKLADLRKNITKDVIIRFSKETAYYKVIGEKFSKPMRGFHNWIKSNLISTYCHARYKAINNTAIPKLYNLKNKVSVFDIACGRGGDIRKFFDASVSNVVGIDIAYDGIIDPTNGAFSRYETMRKQFPNFPEMIFIQADAGLPLELDAQMLGLNGMTNENKLNFEKIFSNNNSKNIYFDIINCQFAVHYMLKDKNTWTNFKNNINLYLKNNGIFICTTFDGQKILDLLKNQSNFKYSFTDDSGKSITLFEIIKRYSDSQIPNNLGIMIDVLMSWIDSDTYISEPLVIPSFFINELQKDCNLTLIDSDSFENQFNQNKNYFLNFNQYEFVQSTKKTQNDIVPYYDDNKINNGLHIYTNLNRYYVFQKNIHAPQSGSGPDSDVVIESYKSLLNFNDTSKYSIVNIFDTYNHSYKSINALCYILKKEKLIPKTLNFKSLCNKFQITDFNNLSTIAQKLLNGYTIFVIEENCNKEFDISIYNPDCDENIILVLKNELYFPLFFIDTSLIGIFKYNHPLIIELYKQL